MAFRKETVYEQLNDGINAVVRGNVRNLKKSFKKLETADPEEVTTNLVLIINELLEKHSLETLVENSQLPVPENPEEIIEAGRARDMDALKAMSEEGTLKAAIEKLLQVAICFKSAIVVL